MKIMLLAGIAALSIPAVANAQVGDAAGITRAQAEAQAAQQFAQLDANSDGNLAPEEVEQVFAKRMEERRLRMEERMKQLSPDERASFEARRGEGGGPRGGRRRFALEGPVSLAQFKEQALARFDRLDTDRNGTVSPEEQAAARPPRTQDRPEQPE